MIKTKNIRTSVLILLSVATLNIGHAQQNVDFEYDSWYAKKSKNIVYQNNELTCGAAVAAMLLMQFGYTSSESSALQEMYLHMPPVVRLKRAATGFSLLDIAQLLRRRGLVATGLQPSMAQLLQITEPTVLHLKVSDGLHYAIFTKYENGWVFLRDSARGNIQMTPLDLAVEWTGIVLVVSEAPIKLGGTGQTLDLMNFSPQVHFRAAELDARKILR